MIIIVIISVSIRLRFKVFLYKVTLLRAKRLRSCVKLYWLLQQIILMKLRLMLFKKRLISRLSIFDFIPESLLREHGQIISLRDFINLLGFLVYSLMLILRIL